MLGIRKRREKEKMKLIRKYEYVKISIIQQLCDKYDITKDYGFEYFHNLYSITYNEKTGFPDRIRRTPDKTDTHEIRYELGSAKEIYYFDPSKDSEDSKDYLDEIYAYECPMTRRKTTRGGYVVGLYDLYDYYNEN